MKPEPGAEYVCLGLRWGNRQPSLDLVDSRSGSRGSWPVIGEFIGFEVADAKRYCMGRFGLNADNVSAFIPCLSLASRGSRQCEKCTARDEFRHVHHAHTGGYLPDSLVAYMSQKHWVYVATFADGGDKVGTAVEFRKQSRLDEQGPAAASFVARATSGQHARILEDLITAELGVSQFKRNSTKAKAYTRPFDADTVARNHEESAHKCRQLLNDRGHADAVVDEVWRRPAQSEVFVEPLVSYPHDLATGSHGLHIVGACGQLLAARFDADASTTPYLIDFGQLKGRRIVFGDFRSAETAVQDFLF